MNLLIPVVALMCMISCGEWPGRQSQTIELPNGDVQSQVNLNSGWEYLEQKVGYLELADISGDQWEQLNLPHTWNAIDGSDELPGYRRSSSWYRKHITFPKYSGAIHLYFEGVNLSSSVFVNGKKAGGHVGGFIGFEVDITEYVIPGRSNEILVWVDNSENLDIIPSGTSNFVVFGGITRDVWLKFYPEVSLRTVHISTPEVRKEKASTKVQVQVNSKLDTEKSVKIVASLVDPDGNKRSSSSIKAKVDPGISVLAIKLTDIENPKLWSPGAPYLYSVQVTLEAGQIRDELSDRFGYRWYDLEEGVPFNLNGESLTLKAMERYEKRTGLGSALPDSLHRRDLEMIKEKGANIVRLAHHPHDPEVYRACDELGLLVWDEFPWCCGGMGGEYWQSVTERLFKEQISQNYNHPSIIFWSFGGKQDWKSQDLGSSNEELKTYVSYLNSVARDYDPYRRTSMQRFQDWADRYGITYE